jgi:hypothetical protein
MNWPRRPPPVASESAASLPQKAGRCRRLIRKRFGDLAIVPRRGGHQSLARPEETAKKSSNPPHPVRWPSSLPPPKSFPASAMSPSDLQCASNMRNVSPGPPVSCYIRSLSVASAVSSPLFRCPHRLFVVLPVCALSFQRSRSHLWLSFRSLAASTMSSPCPLPLRPSVDVLSHVPLLTIRGQRVLFNDGLVTSSSAVRCPEALSGREGQILKLRAAADPYYSTSQRSVPARSPGRVRPFRSGPMPHASLQITAMRQSPATGPGAASGQCDGTNSSGDTPHCWQTQTKRCEMDRDDSVFREFHPRGRCSAQSCENVTYVMSSHMFGQIFCESQSNRTALVPGSSLLCFLPFIFVGASALSRR